MSFTLAACLSALLSGVILFLIQKTLTPGLLLIVALSPIVVGYGMISDDRGLARHGIVILLAPLLVVIGLTLGGRRSASAGPSTSAEMLPPRPLRHVTTFILGLTAVHFASVGVPALSASVETARFDIGSSGFFGLPSRAVLFGLPVLALIVACQPKRVSPHLYKVIMISFVISRMGLGFKGGLADVLMVLLTASIVRGRVLRPKTIALFTIGAVAALGYASVVGSHYGTLAASGTSKADYLVNRLTIEAARPGWYMLEYQDEILPSESAVRHDSAYFAQKYAGVGKGRDFAVDQLVSSLVTNTPRSTRYFLVPVTVGGPAYLYVAGGIGAAIAGLIVIGAVFSRSTRLLAQASSYCRLLLGATLITGLRIFLLDGGGVYVVLNYSFTFLLLYIPFAYSGTFANVSTRRQGAPAC